MRFNRIFLLVLDSLGVGASKDASLYGDLGANTLKHIIENYPLNVPNMKELGFYNLLSLAKVKTKAYYTKAIPISQGKDSMVGHYELMGLKTKAPYQTFTETGFPKELIMEIISQTGYQVIGNKAASGTEIIQELGAEHLKSKALIVYTSVDSVLQIAAHEEIIPLSELYKICEIVRKITTKDEWKVGRVIARPFVGTVGNFKRTANRRDYALKPPTKTALDYLKKHQYEVISIGKIADIFDFEGITKDYKTIDNKDGFKMLNKVLDDDFKGLCFVNLNDFDSKYGHRRDISGYGKALEETDKCLPLILNKLKIDDLLIMTADHGNDPLHLGTDHTREMIPVIIYAKSLKEPKRLATLETFADIGQTILDNFKIKNKLIGTSFLDKLN